MNQPRPPHSANLPAFVDSTHFKKWKPKFSRHLTSSQQIFHYIPMDVCQAKAPSLMLVGQALMVYAEQV